MLRALLAAALLLVLAPDASASTTWLPSVRISAPAPDASEGADVAGDDAGDALAVWVREGVVQASWHPSGGGWEAAVDLSAAGRTASTPQVKMDGAGDALVVWAESSPSGTVIRSRSRPPGGDLSAPSPLSEGGASDPRIAIDPAGAAVVGWLMADGGHQVVQAAVRDTAEDRFGLPALLSDPAAATDAYNVRVGIDAAGDAVAAWTQGTSPTFRIDAASRPAHGSWAGFQTAVSGSRDPELSVGRDGTSTIFFPLGGSIFQIASVASAFGGSWSTPVTVSGGTSYEAIHVVLDADGTPILIHEPPNGGDPLLSAGPVDGPEQTLVEFNIRASSDFGITASSGGGTLAYHWHGAFQSWWRPQGGTFGRRISGASFDAIGTMGVALDGQGNGVAVWQQQNTTGWSIHAAGLDATPPAVSELAIPDSVPQNVEVPMSVSVSDRWSAVNEVTWRFSDGDNGIGASISHTFSTPGTTSLTITARDASGNASTLTRTIDVIAPAVVSIPPPPDADHDGVPDAVDCAPADAAVRPGALEIPGNAVDENCDGRADPFPTVPGTAQLVTVVAGTKTRLLTLNVREASVGDTLTLHCTGAGCKKSLDRTIAVRVSTPSLSLSRYVRGAKLGRGARIELRIAHPQHVTRIYTFTMGKRAPRQTRQCLAPGAKRATTC